MNLLIFSENSLLLCNKQVVGLPQEVSQAYGIFFLVLNHLCQRKASITLENYLIFFQKSVREIYFDRTGWLHIRSPDE